MEKNIDTIYSEMLAAFSEKSGYLPHSSCDLAARLYAAAAQLQALYHQARWVLDQSFPQTAQGAYLDQHAALRGLSRAVATRAAGVLRFGVSAAASGDLPIDAGTVCMTADGIRFATTEDAVLAEGELYVDVPALAVEPGRAGNVAAGAVTIMAAMPVGIRACANPEAFSGGDDLESDDDLRRRLLDTYLRLPNGANAAYYEQSAMSFPQVAAAAVVSRPRGVGSVDVVVATSAGVPDEELLEELQAYFEERREIAVDLQVRAPEKKQVSVTIRVQAEENRDAAAVRQEVEQAIHSWFDGRRLGQDVLRAKLGELTFDVPGVKNYVIDAPTADIAVSSDVLPWLESLTISEWGAGA